MFMCAFIDSGVYLSGFLIGDLNTWYRWWRVLDMRPHRCIQPTNYVAKLGLRYVLLDVRYHGTAVPSL